MTALVRLVTTAARAGGAPALLARAGVLTVALLLAPAASAQAVTWEKMPGVQELPTDPEDIVAVGFLRGEGPAAADPAADTLVVFSFDGGAFLYNPSGAAGAAGDNGAWGPWHRLCSNARCSGPSAGLVTSSGTVLLGARTGATRIARGTNRGRVWTVNYEDHGAYPIFESARPGPGGPPPLFIGSGPANTSRSVADGAPGTWEPRGTACCFPESFGEVPPSPALPAGRLLFGADGGVSYSDDGGLSFVPATGPGARTSIVWSFAFVPDAAHPYGGAAYAGVHDFAHGGEFRGASVLRSGDGGATWAVAHRFTGAEFAIPMPTNVDLTRVALLATDDGTLWAGVSANGSQYRRGGVVRSVDGGQTWARADAGYRNGQGWGYGASQLAVSRTGVLYAATTRGVWRTTTAVVAGEASPVEAPRGVGVSVRPNPAGGRVEVVVSLAVASAVRVAVVDALGREVAVVLDGTAVGDQVVGVDTASWPAGVYVVRATASSQVATARLVVAR